MNDTTTPHVDQEQLKNAIESFDELLQLMLNDPPEGFSVKTFGINYNVLRNALAYYMSKEDE